MSDDSKNTSAPDNTEQKQGPHRFAKGESGNPRGRPRGSRNRYAAQFIDDFHDDWLKYGPETIARVRQRSPETYVKVGKDLIPREIISATLTVAANVDFADVEDARAFLQAYRRVRDGETPMIEAEPLHADEGAVVTHAWRADDD